MSCGVLYLLTDNPIRVEGLFSESSQAYVNDATVQLTLHHDAADGDEVAGQAWPLTLDYVAGSDGDYLGTVQDDVVVEEGDVVVAVIEIDGDGLQQRLELTYEFMTLDDAAVYWTSRRELEDMFGRENVRTWADLENEDDDDDVLRRVRWVVRWATSEARTRLGRTRYRSLDCAPDVLRQATTRLAGVLLYESRGVKDADGDGNPVHRLRWHRTEADKFFRRVKADQVDLGTVRTVTSIPQIIDED